MQTYSRWKPRQTNHPTDCANLHKENLSNSGIDADVGRRGLSRDDDDFRGCALHCSDRLVRDIDNVPARRQTRGELSLCIGNQGCDQPPLIAPDRCTRRCRIFFVDRYWMRGIQDRKWLALWSWWNRLNRA